MYDKEQMIALVEQYQQYITEWKTAVQSHAYQPEWMMNPVDQFGFREWLWLIEQGHDEYYIIYGEKREEIIAQ